MDQADPASGTTVRLAAAVRMVVPFLALGAMIVLILLAPSRSQMPAIGSDLFVEVVRKVGHVVGYAAFAIVTALAVGAVRVRGGPGIVRAATARQALLTAWLLTGLVAGADEARQAFLPDRTASWLDLALDVAAATAGLAILAIWARGRSGGGARESRPIDR